MHSDDDADQANNPIDAGSIQACRRPSQTHGLKDARAVVVDCVRSGELHEDEHGDSDKDAFAVARSAERFPLGEHTAFTEAVPVVVDGIHDTGKFFFEIWVTDGKTSKLDQRLRCSAARSVLSEPSTM
jgi:hypothetical protein